MAKMRRNGSSPVVWPLDKPQMLQMLQLLRMLQLLAGRRLSQTEGDRSGRKTVSSRVSSALCSA